MQTVIDFKLEELGQGAYRVSEARVLGEEPQGGMLLGGFDWAVRDACELLGLVGGEIVVVKAFASGGDLTLVAWLAGLPP